ncbi:MAG: S9 family peptidase [Trueperella sp.]|nr:S9 family peptidase [Trueperella sp.]
MTSPPQAEKRASVRSFHGDDFTDYYAWMSDLNDPEMRAHLAAENAWFSQRTAHLGELQEKLVAEMAAHTQEDDVTAAVRRGDYWYWTRTWDGREYPGYFRVAATGAERPDPATLAADSDAATVVYDGNELAAGEDFFAIGSRAISPDAELCALAVDNSGGEEFTLRVHHIDSGAVRDDAVRHIGYGLVWSADSKYLYYTRNDDAWRSYQVWRHEVGTSPENDELLFQEDEPGFEVGLESSRDGKWAVVTSQSTTTQEVRLFSLVNRDESFVVCPRQPGLDYSVEVAGDKLLILHNLHNIGFDLSWAPLGPSQPADWQLVFAAGAQERLVEVQAFADFAAVLFRSGGGTALQVIPAESYAGKTVAGVPASYRIPTPEGASLEFYANPQWETGELVFTQESLVEPPTQIAWEVANQQATVLKQLSVPGYDPAQFVTYREFATAADGTQITLTIAHRADLPRDGSAPGLLYGYGSYEISIDPWFSVNFLPILERGMVYAIAHIRGGGEMGRQWYEDGKLDKKRNTFTDFIAAADHLHTTGLVAPDRLAAEGRSAGGLLMGAVANLGRDRFRVIHAGVPFVDALTTILNPDMPLTVGEWEEWGNPLASEEIYWYMRSYSPYDNVEAAEYPAILATTSLNDIRVSCTEPTKWIAKLQELATNDPVARPIVQHTEMVAGHGGGTGRYKKWQQRAEELAFIFDQLGITQ